jgi:PAS domain S-box-containing protein
MPIQSTSSDLPHPSKEQEVQELLKHSQKRFSTLVENIPGAVYRCAYDGQLQGLPLRRMVFVSEAIRTISGYPPSDFINDRVRSFSSIVHPQDRAKAEQAIRQSISAKQPYIIEYRIVRANGNIVWVYDKGQAISDETGEIRWLDGVILDITERKQTEADLHYTQTFLNSIVENLPLAVFMKDANDLRIVYWNKASEELLGYCREEVLGKNDYDFLPHEQARYSCIQDRQLLTNGESLTQDIVPIATPHRGQRFFKSKKVPLFDEAGTPRYLLGIYEDITEGQLATSAAARSAQELRESEAHYRRIVETATEGVWMFDADSQTTFANARMAQMLGYSVEEMLGRSLFDFMDEDSQVQARAYVERRKQGIHERHDFKFRRQDGSVLWAIVSATPILDASGQFVGVLRMITDISDRKQAEQQLQEREQFLRSIYEGVENSIFVVDVVETENRNHSPPFEFRYRGLNPAHERVTGICSQELRGKTPDDILPLSIAVAANERYEQCVRTGTTLSYEECLPIHGKETWWITKLTPLRDAQGRIYRLVGTSTNICDRKRAEEALQESERRFRAIFDSMFQFIGLLKPDGTLLQANQTALEFGGLQLADVAGRPFWEISWWSLSSQIQERLKVAIAQAAAGDFVRYEVDVIGAGNQVITIDFSIKPVKDETGKVVLLIPEGRDISDKKQTEKALRDSEQRFRATFDRAPVGIAHVDLEGKFLRINQKFCDLLGYTQEEILTRTFEDITHPDDMEVHLAYLGQVLTGEIETYSMEKRYIARSGEIVWVNLTVSLRRRSSGEPKYFIAVAQDISAVYKELRLREQAEAALRQSERQLRAKNQQLKQTLNKLQQTQAQLIQNEKMVSLGQLVAGIAHEINNPISFIYGNVSHAQQYTADLFHLLQLYTQHYPEPVPEIQQEMSAIELNFLKTDFPKLLNSMQQGAQRIRNIVLSLRNFSRLDEAKMKLVNLHDGIESTLLILQHRLKETPSHPGIQICREYGQLPLVECNAGLLNQVFMNLLSNAIDALESQPSPRVITIHTSVRVGDSQDSISHPQSVVIRLSDNGPGIPLKVQKQMFDPFFTTKPVGIGTGLGLWIAHSIVVEKHGGKIECCSAPEEGAEFVIELPIRQSGVAINSVS